MIGALLVSLASLVEELSATVGKLAVARRQESVYTMGFLDALVAVALFAVLGLVAADGFSFSAASLPTFVPRVLLEILQAHYSMHALALAARSTFNFLRTLTIPALLLVDVALGYALGTSQLVGVGLIVFALLVLFANHGIEKPGAGFVLFTSLNAAVTITLFKYDITRHNSVAAEQGIVFVVLAAYFLLMALFRAKENPFALLRRKMVSGQSMLYAAGVTMESVAYSFAPASIILTAKRASGVFWSILTGNRVFHEKHWLLKISVGTIAVTGFVLLIL